jgi:hypothetical protein
LQIACRAMDGPPTALAGLPPSRATDVISSPGKATSPFRSPGSSMTRQAIARHPAERAAGIRGSPAWLEQTATVAATEHQNTLNPMFC